MLNKKTIELLPKIHFHFLFKAYTEIINANKQYDESAEFEFPYNDMYYEMCNTDEKVKTIATEITDDNINNGCHFIIDPEILKCDAKPKILFSYVNLYLDNIINADNLALPPLAKQSPKDCKEVLPLRKQREAFEKILKTEFDLHEHGFKFDLSMLNEFGGYGQSTHKRFCIDEMLLILQREKLIDNITVGWGKDYRDDDYGECAPKPFYNLTKQKVIHYNNGFWHNTVDNEIGYGENKISNLFHGNTKPIEQAHLLHIFISLRQGEKISDNDIKAALAKRGIKKEINKLTDLRNNALALVKDMPGKVFKIKHTETDGVCFYFLTSEN